MADPTKPTVDYSYTGFASGLGDGSFPGTQLDNDFQTVVDAAAEAVDAIKELRRSDGALKNGIVTRESLSTDLTLGVSLWTDWLTGTAYTAGDAVTYDSNKVYQCLVAHTSGTFATDLGAGYWDLLLTAPTGPTGPAGADGADGSPGATGATGATGAAGDDGWTPVFSVVSDGSRRVLQVSDWTGGAGTKPTTGQYVSASGFTGTIGSAVDIRGAAGAGSGDMLIATYDPTAVSGDAFAMDSMVEGTTTKILTATERSEIAANTAAKHTHSNKAILDNVTAAFTTAQETKLSGIATGAEVNTVDSVNSLTGAVVLDPDDLDDTSTTNKFTTASDISKLAGIEAGATADMSNSEIKVAYEANADTNAYTDAEKTKLSGIETAADVTDAANVAAAGAAMVSTYDPTAVGGDAFAMDNMVEGTNTKIMTSAERTKLAGITTTVKSYIDLTDYSPAGDGTTSDQTAVANAVAAAYAAGEWLYWPAGTYLTTASISNLHSVKHFGPGVLKRGSALFYLSNRPATTNRLYANPSTGSSSNDGLSSSEPCTLQGCIDAMENYGPTLPGTWYVYSAAGTWAEGIIWPTGLRSENRVMFYGATASRDEPTTIISGASASLTVGFYAKENSNVGLVDFKVTGFTTAGYYGILSTDFSTLYLENCWCDGNYYNIGSRIHTRLIMKYGKAINGVYANILMLDFALCTIGYQGSTVYSGSGAFASTDGSYIGGGTLYGVFASESVQGHVDYCLVDGNNIGIFEAYGTRLNVPGCTISNNTVGVNCAGGSFIIDTGSTYTSNTDDYLWNGFSGRVESNMYADQPNVGHTAFLGRDTTSTSAPATTGSYQKHIDAFATVPGGALKDSSGRLRVRAVGSIGKSASASGRMVAFRLYAGGSYIAAGSINTNTAASGQIIIEIEVFATSSSAQKHVMNISAGATRLSYFEETFVGTSAVDMSSDLDLHIYTWRDNVSDTVTFEIVSAELYGVME